LSVGVARGRDLLAVHLPDGIKGGFHSAAARRAGIASRCRHDVRDVAERGGAELAALGIIWTAIMTTVSSAFFVLSRRYGLSAR
jgi:hypothetical protein